LNLRCIAINAGPYFKFNEAISLMIPCKDQNEIDYYWEALTTNGGQESVCGWCKDKYGLIPTRNMLQTNKLFCNIFHVGIYQFKIWSATQIKLVNAGKYAQRIGQSIPKNLERLNA
jgi:hypothetical protein